MAGTVLGTGNAQRGALIRESVKDSPKPAHVSSTKCLERFGFAAFGSSLLAVYGSFLNFWDAGIVHHIVSIKKSRI
jgi:hypothetical protein